MNPDRRRLIATAAALGAVAAWGGARAKPSATGWSERRARFPQGVASGDPGPDRVLLWTRCPDAKGLTLEVARDEAFTQVVARTAVAVSADTDWTCRVLAGGLKPASVYWYRFTDTNGDGSRIGRTITAPAADDPRAVRFAFVSCQNACQGAQNAYRRMIFEDEQASAGEQLGFVLHLGDFVYEIVWYPEDRPQGMYDRRLRDLVRYPTGEKVKDFHVPVDLADYRALYKAYLTDPDIQDARARWPFVCMWDNHEFSWKGWQSTQEFGDVRPAQTRKVAANQAWFEYQPMRVAQPSGALDRFTAPKVKDTPAGPLDDHGLDLGPDNLAAVGSLTVYRALRFGRHVELILTDNRSYRTWTVTARPEAAAFGDRSFPGVFPDEAVDMLDAGAALRGGAPASISFGGKPVANFRRDQPAQSMLGVRQKAWFLDRLADSNATWKVWGNSVGSLDVRLDLHNLPDGPGPKWPGAGYGVMTEDDWGGYRTERRAILNHVAQRKITGLACLAGDRHAFHAGRMAADLPPKAAFAPVGVEFIVGSVSAPGLAEGFKHNLPKDHPWRAVWLYDPPGGPEPLPAVNLTARHGVKASLAYARTGHRAQALAVANPEAAPNLDFLDWGGHGYAVVTADAKGLETEFVCVPRPLERAATPDGGPLRYRVTHRADLWKPGEPPKLVRTRAEGELPIGNWT